MAILFALCAGMSNALATVLQRIGVEQVPGDATRSRSLMASVMRRPVWFYGLAFMTASFLLQALALSLGDLTTVQPVMVTELVFLLAILGFWFHSTIGWREWLGVCATAAGLGVFLAVGTPRAGNLQPGAASWVLVLGASSGGIAVALVLAQRGPRWWRAAWYGVGGGIAFALTAAFIKVSSLYVRSGGYARLFLHWQPYSVAVAGLVGLVITQHALQAGPIAASQSTLLIVNPVSSILMGILLFGDRLHTTRGREVIDVLSLCVMFIGLFVLSHSPLISRASAEEQLSAGRPPVPAQVELGEEASR